MSVPCWDQLSMSCGLLCNAFIDEATGVGFRPSPNEDSTLQALRLWIQWPQPQDDNFGEKTRDTRGDPPNLTIQDIRKHRFPISNGQLPSKAPRDACNYFYLVFIVQDIHG